MLELNHFSHFALCGQSCWAPFPNSTRRPHCGNFLFDIVRKLRSFCWVGYRWSWITSPILWPLFGEPLSEVVPGFLVIHIPIQAVCRCDWHLTILVFQEVSLLFSHFAYLHCLHSTMLPLEHFWCHWNFCCRWNLVAAGTSVDIGSLQKTCYRQNRKSK